MKLRRGIYIGFAFIWFAIYVMGVVMFDGWELITWIICAMIIFYIGDWRYKDGSIHGAK